MVLWDPNFVVTCNISVYLHVFRPVPNMCSITFEVPRLGTFVFKKSSEKKTFTIIFVVRSLKGFGWNNVGPASHTVTQHYFTMAFHEAVPVWQSEQARDNHSILFQCWMSNTFDVEYD